MCVCVCVVQPNAKFLLGYVNRCEYTTKLLLQTAEHHRLIWRAVCKCTQLSSSHHPHILEFTLQLAADSDVTVHRWWRLGMWRSSNSTTFELQTFSTDSKFNERFKRFVVECEFVEKSLFYDWFHMYRQPESANEPFFSQIQDITQTTVIECAI